MLSLASAVGGRKTALVAGVAANVLASSHLPSQASAPDPPHATAAAAGSSSSAGSSTSSPDVSDGTSGVGVVCDGGASEIVVLQVIATAPAGGVMRVHVEGVGDFELTVPPGVTVGKAFAFEVEVPRLMARMGGGGGELEAVPMGLPVAARPHRRARAAFVAAAVGEHGGYT